MWLQQAQGMVSGTVKSQMCMFSQQVHPSLGTKLNAREFSGAQGKARTKGDCIMIATQTPKGTPPGCERWHLWVTGYPPVCHPGSGAGALLSVL